MRYLAFLDKLTKSLKERQGVDALWESLSRDDKSYLTHNAARLPLLGGEQRFYHVLADKLGIASNAEAADTLTLKQQCIEAIHTLEGEPEALKTHPAILLINQAVEAAVRDDNTEIYKHLAPLQHPKASYIQPGIKSLKQLQWDPAIFEYHLTQSAEAATLKNSLIEDVTKSLRAMQKANTNSEGLSESEQSALEETLTGQILKWVKENYAYGSYEHHEKVMVGGTILGILPRELRIELLSQLPVTECTGRYGAIIQQTLNEITENDVAQPDGLTKRTLWEREKDAGRDAKLLGYAIATGNEVAAHTILHAYGDAEKRVELIKQVRFRGLSEAAGAGDFDCIKTCMASIPDHLLANTLIEMGFPWYLTSAAEEKNTALFEVLADQVQRLPQPSTPPSARTNMVLSFKEKETAGTETSIRTLLATRIIAQAILDPGTIEQQKDELAKALRYKPNAFYIIVDSEKHKNSLQQVKLLASIAPQAFEDFIHDNLNSRYPDNITDNADEYIEAAPEALKERIASAIHTKQRTQPRRWSYDDGSQDYKDYREWKDKFGDAPWLKDFSTLKKNPHGFRYEVYAPLLPLMRTACRLEGNRDYGAADTCAYKLASAFGDAQKAEQYLTKFAPRDSNQPIHDALLFEVPEKGKWNQEIWRQFGLRDGMGPRAMRLLSLAPKIEQKFAGKPCSQWGRRETHQFKQFKIEDLVRIARKVGYTNSALATELADLCIQTGVEETVFEKARKLLEPTAITEKRTPDINIDGGTVGFSGFHFRRVAATHPWNAFIGKLVNCCNYIGGATEAMAQAQINHPDCSLYVLTNRDNEPIAKCTGWISTKNNFVFNAWERLSPSYDKFCEPFLLAAAVAVLEKNPTINRVTLGRNKGSAAFPLISDPESPTEARIASADADVQYEVATRAGLEQVKQRLREFSSLSGRTPPLRQPDPWTERIAGDLSGRSVT